MIIGIDNGYGYTKTSNQQIFKSCITTTEPMSLDKGYSININDTNYWIGSGNGTVDINKIDSDVNKVCTLLALAINSSSSYEIVAGLPISQYRKSKDIFKKTILSYNNSRIYYNNQHRTININNVYVYPQSLAALYSMPFNNEDIIIVDIGYRTVDVVCVKFNDNKPQADIFDTYYCGIYTLYDKLAGCINNRFDLTLTADDVSHIINTGLTVDGIKQDLSFIVPVLAEHFQNLFNQLQMNYPTRIMPILLVGGGSNVVYKAFTHRFNNVKLHPNNQFANAIGYYNIGIRVFS